MMVASRATRPCDELARALVDVVPENLAVLVLQRSVTVANTTFKVNDARVAIARWLGVEDELSVWLTACGSAAWFVRAPGAHRLVGVDAGTVLTGMNLAPDPKFRAPHAVVFGRVDCAEFSDADVTLWRSLLQDASGAVQRTPLVMPTVCRCHKSFCFIDKHMATRVLTAAFALKTSDSRVPKLVALDGVQYLVAHNWKPSPRST
jgi:hypothetical protein